MALITHAPPSIGLALGGGGARGLAHIGVLRVLEREHIPVRCIAGTSAGAIVGAMIAQLGTSAEVEERVRNFFASDRYRSLSRRLAATKQKDARSKNGLIDRMAAFVKQQYVVNKAFQDLSLLDRSVVDTALRALLDEEDIRDTRIPFAAVATDLWKGEDVVLTRGSIRRAVLASASIPGIFPPVEWDGRSLVDGCVINMVPVHETRGLGAGRVIAVDVTRELVRPRAFKNGLEVMFRSDEITNYRLNEIHLGTADVVVRPRMGDAHWADFDRFDEFLGLGEAAAEEKLPEIRALARPARRRWFGLFSGLGRITGRGASAPAPR